MTYSIEYYESRIKHGEKLTKQEQAELELLKNAISLHQEWLKNSLTTDLMRILVQRRLKYETELFQHILQRSDKEFEDKYRSALTTCDTIIKIISDSEIFLQQLNNK